MKYAILVAKKKPYHQRRLKIWARRFVTSILKLNLTKFWIWKEDFRMENPKTVSFRLKSVSLQEGVNCRAPIVQGGLLKWASQKTSKKWIPPEVGWKLWSRPIGRTLAKEGLSSRSDKAPTLEIQCCTMSCNHNADTANWLLKIWLSPLPKGLGVSWMGLQLSLWCWTKFVRAVSYRDQIGKN